MYDEKLVVPDTHKQFQYCVYQREKCPTTQREHWQGYIEFKRSLRINTVKKAFQNNTIHLEPRHGSREEAREYCMVAVWKGEDKGQIPGTTTEVGEWLGKDSGKRNDLESLAKLVQEGKKDWELAEAMPSTFGRHKKMVDTLRHSIRPKLKEEPSVNVLYGDPGTGKTRTVFDNHPIEDIFVMEGEYKWFDGYQGQPVVLFDEFYCQFKLSFLLQLLDRYPIRVPIKGGFVPWTPSIIYLTSNSPPDCWYPQCFDAQRRALQRRLTNIIHLTEEENHIKVTYVKGQPPDQGAAEGAQIDNVSIPPNSPSLVEPSETSSL